MAPYLTPLTNDAGQRRHGLREVLNALLDFDLTTVDGSVTGLHYVPGAVDDSSTALPFIIVLSTSTLFRSFQLTLDGLTTAGAPVLIGSADSFDQTDAGRREIVAGSVVGVAATPSRPRSSWPVPPPWSPWRSRRGGVARGESHKPPRPPPPGAAEVPDRDGLADHLRGVADAVIQL